MSVHEPELLDVDLEGPEQSRRPIVAGVAAGLWSLLVGVALVTCLVMLAWAVSPNSAGDSAAAWRAAGAVWLGAHQVPLEIGGRALTLLPLGAVLLGLLLTRRSGRWAGRLLAGTTPGEAVGIVVSCALVYGAGGAGVAWLAAGPGTGASPPAAFVGTAVVALVGTTWGIAHEAELVARVRSRVSDAAWRTALGGLAAVVGLFAAGAVLVSVSLIRHLGQIASTMADLSAGAVGEFVLTALGALCLPTLDIWGLAVVVGPGFDLGSAGGLDAFGGQVQSLPALPVLAAIPTTVPAWGPLLMLVPVGLGVLSARIRWGRDLPTLTGTAISGAGLAGVVAALTGGLVLLASGSLGGGRLSEVGPALLPVAAAAAGLVLLGFLAEAAFQSLRLSWELHQAEQRAEDRRLRRAARGVTDPVAESEGAEGAAAGAAAQESAAPEGIDLIDPADLGAVQTTEPAPRRQPPRIREARVITVVAAAAPDVTPHPVADDIAGTGTGQGELPASAGEAADRVADDPVAAGSAATADSATGGQSAADSAGGELLEQEEPVAPSAEWDGDSTVDLIVGPDDLAAIRAAQDDASPVGDTATETS